MFDLDNDFPALYVESYVDENNNPYILVDCLCGKGWHMSHKFAVGDELRALFMPHWLNECPIRKEKNNVQMG